MAEEEGKFIISPREIIEDGRLSFWQIKVLLALYSFRNRNTDLVYPTRESISKRCGIRPSSISKTTTELVKLGWLEKAGKGGNNKATVYRVTVPNFSTVQESCTVQESSTVTVQESCTRKNTIKEYPVVKKPKIDLERVRATPRTIRGSLAAFPELNIDPETWEEFKNHRKKIKKPMTPYAEKLILKKLVKFKEQGHEPNECLEATIANGWQGVFEPKPQQAKTKYLSADERARENTSWLDEEILKRREHGEDEGRGNFDSLKIVH